MACPRGRMSRLRQWRLAQLPSTVAVYLTELFSANPFSQQPRNTHPQPGSSQQSSQLHLFRSLANFPADRYHGRLNATTRLPQEKSLAPATRTPKSRKHIQSSRQPGHVRRLRRNHFSPCPPRIQRTRHSSQVPVGPPRLPGREQQLHSDAQQICTVVQQGV